MGQTQQLKTKRGGGECVLIDVAIPVNRNVAQKEAEKGLKYNSLCTALQHIWNTTCMITPLIIGATGTATKGLKKNMEAIVGKHSTNSLQKTPILGTSHIIRKVLKCEGGGNVVYWMCEVSGELSVIQIITWSLQRLGKDQQWANRRHRG